MVTHACVFMRVSAFATGIERSRQRDGEMERERERKREREWRRAGRERD